MQRLFIRTPMPRTPKAVPAMDVLSTLNIDQWNSLGSDGRTFKPSAPDASMAFAVKPLVTASGPQFTHGLDH